MDIRVLNLPFSDSDNGVPGLLSFDNTQVARTGMSLQVAWQITNQSTRNLSNASAELQLPPDVTLSGVPAGVNHDTVSNRLTWTGEISGGQSQTFTLNVDYNSNACNAAFLASAGTGNTTDTDSSLLILTAPPASDVPFLVGTDSTYGLWRLQANNQRVPTLCVITEYTDTVSVAPGGDIYMRGLPEYRVNPITLEFEYMDYAAIAGFPVRGIANNLYGAEGETYFFGGGTIIQFNSRTRQTTTVLSDPTRNFDTEAFVDSDNRLILADGTDIVRIDLNGTFPVAPAAVEVFPVDVAFLATPPGVLQSQRVIPIGVDTDEDYLIGLRPYLYRE